MSLLRAQFDINQISHDGHANNRPILIRQCINNSTQNI